MILKTVFVRFYKSFNYDYLRKFHATAKPSVWESIDEMWYPYVRVPVDPKVTTVVGANESGKSQLLTTIEKGLSGVGIEREDFCRYSNFFTVETGKLKLPHFGFEFDNLEDKEQAKLKDIFSLKGKKTADTDHFLVFRTEKSQLAVYLKKDGDYIEHTVDKEKQKELLDIFPHVFWVDAEIALLGQTH